MEENSRWTISKAKQKTKKIKNKILVNYILLAVIAILCLNGHYNTTTTKLFGILNVILIALNHYQLTKQSDKQNKILEMLLEIEAILPKLQITMGNYKEK